MRNRTSLSSELLPGTLEMLILKTLSRGPAHGYAIARHLERVSGDVLRVGESSLYPALQRLLLNDWVQAAWGESELKRRARIYRELSEEMDFHREMLEREKASQGAAGEAAALSARRQLGNTTLAGE